MKKTSFAVTVLTLSVVVQSLIAHDPKPVLRSIYGAPNAVLTIYQVKPGHEGAFMDTMVSTGPYNRLTPAFANERILQPLPSQDGAARYVSLGRYYDLAVARSIDVERNAALSAHLSLVPARFELSLIEHQLADWGWEKRRTPTMVQAKPLEKDELFREHLSSLSFFKSGYVGQVGLLEFFPNNTTLDYLRATLKARSGLSGASIFSLADSGFAVYSEYFVAQAGFQERTFQLSQGSTAGAQAGIVVQNYVAR